MPTAASVIPESLLEHAVVHIEPGRDIALSVDATGAFGPGGTLAVEGAAEAAEVSAEQARNFGRQNALAVIDAHVPGSAHGDDAYTEEAGIVPNETGLTEELIAHWILIGEQRILKPHARFGLRQLRADARLTIMFTGGPQIVWKQHGLMGSRETQFLSPLYPELFANIFFKGTHPVHDSHSGIWDAVGNPVGVMTEIAARPQRVQKIFVDGNALEVCIRLTALNLARFGIEVYIVVDAVGFLPFINEAVRQQMVTDLVKAGVKFVHSSQLQFN